MLPSTETTLDVSTSRVPCLTSLGFPQGFNANYHPAYRIPIGVQFAWSLFLVAGMLVLPETPRFMIKQGNLEGATKALAKIRRLPADDPAVIDELAEVQANHEYELSLGKSTYLDCFKGNLLKRLLTGCALQGLQQLTGINFIFYVSCLITTVLTNLIKPTNTTIVRNPVLQELRLHQLLRHQSNHKLRQHSLHIPRSLRH